MNPFVRGRMIENFLNRFVPAGSRLATNFPTIDRFLSGVATSIKSVNLRAATYATPANLRSLLTGYVNRMARYAGTGPAGWAGVVIRPGDITARTYAKSSRVCSITSSVVSSRG